MAGPSECTLLLISLKGLVSTGRGSSRFNSVEGTSCFGALPPNAEFSRETRSDHPRLTFRFKILPFQRTCELCLYPCENILDDLFARDELVYCGLQKEDRKSRRQQEGHNLFVLVNVLFQFCLLLLTVLESHAVFAVLLLATDLTSIHHF